MVGMDMVEEVKTSHLHSHGEEHFTPFASCRANNKQIIRNDNIKQICHVENINEQVVKKNGMGKSIRPRKISL